MERMHGIDAFSLYCETPSSSFATLKVAIVEPTDPGGADVEGLHSYVTSEARRLGRGLIDRRIVRVPMDLHHPLWVDDPEFSVDDHIGRAGLPAPGGKGELCDFLSDLMGRPLDPDRPLWEVWIVEGLEGDRVAIVLKMHHVLADGRTVADLVARAGQAWTEESAPEAPAEPPGGARDPSASGGSAAGIPGTARLVGGALVDLATTFVEELPGFLSNRRQVLEERASDAEEPEESAEAAEGPGSAPYCVLNAPYTGRYRVYRYETFSLPEFKALAHRFGCTVNVLVLGVVSEAIRRYLDEVDHAPSESLVAAMPVGESGGIFYSTRIHHEPPHNDVSVAFLPLHQDIDDMTERLAAIKRSSDAAIRRVRRSWGRRFDNFLEFLPGAVVSRAVRSVGRKQAKGGSAYANVLVSNVRGPSDALVSPDGRWRMVELLSTGNITDQGHLNITVWSYVDKLSFSFYMRKGALPEPDRIPALVREVVDELRRSTEQGSGADPADADPSRRPAGDRLAGAG